jgi:hypothetical protein
MKCIDRREELSWLVTEIQIRIAESFQKGLGQTCIVFDIDDTLISDESYPIADMVSLLKFAKKNGCAIGLVTARHRSMRKITGEELKGVHILEGVDYAPEDLFFCPDSYRVSYVKISQWKQSARKFLKNKYKTVLCTVGDQWTDLVEIQDELERKRLDEAYSTQITPYLLFELYDGISMYGLKLKSNPIIEPKFKVVSSPPSGEKTTQVDLDS